MVRRAEGRALSSSLATGDPGRVGLPVRRHTRSCLPTPGYTAACWAVRRNREPAALGAGSVLTSLTPSAYSWRLPPPTAGGRHCHYPSLAEGETEAWGMVRPGNVQGRAGVWSQVVRPQRPSSGPSELTCLRETSLLGSAPDWPPEPSAPADKQVRNGPRPPPWEGPPHTHHTQSPEVRRVRGFV